MSKYKPLTEHLRSRNEPFWRATFDDVESVLGFALPKAAEDKSGWWDNGGTTGHSRAWVDAGWHVESVDRPGRRVMFHREGYGAEDPGDSLKRTAGWTAAIGGAVAVAAGLSVLALRRRKKT
jgi:hypothetical protein